MKIHIVNWEAPRFNGILTKFAYRLHDELEKVKGIEVSIGNVPEPTADINHHINYASYRHSSTINTLMITHIDTPSKISNLTEGMKTADFGICMSNWTKNSLIEKLFTNVRRWLELIESLLKPFQDNLSKQFWQTGNFF